MWDELIADNMVNWGRNTRKNNATLAAIQLTDKILKATLLCMACMNGPAVTASGTIPSSGDLRWDERLKLMDDFVKALAADVMLLSLRVGVQLFVPDWHDVHS